MTGERPKNETPTHCVPNSDGFIAATRDNSSATRGKRDGINVILVALDRPKHETLLLYIPYPDGFVPRT